MTEFPVAGRDDRTNHTLGVSGRRIAALRSAGQPLTRVSRRVRRLYRRGRAAVRDLIVAFTRSTAPGVADRRFGERNSGTILLVTHDMEVGGAQQLLKLLAAWLISRTKYSVRFVAMRGGTRRETFRRIAPVFNVALHGRRYDRETVKRKLREFAGPDVKGIFVNSAASGGFYDYWDERETPSIAYIHELPKLMARFADRLEMIKARSTLILTGSVAVRDALAHSYGIPPERCEVAYSFIEDIPPADAIGREDKRRAKRALGLEPDDFVVMGCGVLHWRKSPDKFAEVAARVSAALAGKCRFLWIGAGPEEDAFRALIKERRLDDVVTILGFREDVYACLKGADVFLLPSEEDPFPLVGLYAAAARAPIVCFEDAGGMPEFVRHGRGAAVPYQDVKAMAEAVLRYHAEPGLRDLHGANAQEAALARFTIRTAGPALLEIMRRTMRLKPHLSVIVPSYNYDRFLEERLHTIRDQTFQDFELILLDDASTDGSLERLRRFAGDRPGTRLIANEVNSGSPFRQWLKGMEAARADLIWVAEADDSCSPRFLERLVSSFDNRNIFLAWSQSAPIGDDGRVLGDYQKIYLNRIADGRWSKSYVASDHREVDAALGIANSIPNASAVVFRKFDPEPAFVDRVSQLLLCGDWHFYLRAARGGAVSFEAEPLNFHRRHAATVTHATEGSERYFDELAVVRSQIGQSFRLSAESIAKARRFLEEDLDRFGIDDPRRREEIRRKTFRHAGAPKAKPSLLVVASDLSPGGGQMFAIRLANAWMQAGGRAFLLNARKYPGHRAVRAKLDSRVALFDAGRADFSFERLLADFDIDIVHSSIWWADNLVLANSGAIPAHVPWVVTMHGCHETLLADPSIDPGFPSRMRSMLKRVDQWVYTADKNTQVFDAIGAPKRLLKIGSGYEPEPVHPIDRTAIGLSSGSFVLCLASRAIREKGWREAVEAVARLNADGRMVDLILIGEGPEADRLRTSGAPPFVHLRGQVDNLQDFIAAADVGLLPSRFLGESMPLVIIDFFAQGKPVIATDIGEIGSMIRDGEGDAGTLLPLRDGRLRVEDLAEAIAAFHADRPLLETAGRHAARLFSNYSMAEMLRAYERVYAAAAESRPAREGAVQAGAHAAGA